MTVSSWRNAALASLTLASCSVCSGQRIILVGPSSAVAGGAGPSSSMAGGEPPCRRLRLEPWRQQVREQCLAETNEHCSRDQRDLRDRDIDFFASSPFAASPLFKEADSMFRDFFASPPSSAGAYRREEDPFENLFNNMLGFSLRAFDEMMMESATLAVKGDQDGKEEEGEWEKEQEEWEEDQAWHDHEVATEEEEDSEDSLEEAIPAPPSSADESSVDDTTSPEQQAENVLDAMVASLMRSASASAADEDDLAFLDNLPQRLFLLGNGLLAETHSRRRLTEAGEADADPHLRVKERLGRRLTEYRTDLFYYPDGTVTVYRMSSPQPRSTVPAFVKSLPGGVPYVAPLGLGSDSEDECIRSRYVSGALEEGCHGAVRELLEAVNDRSKIPPGREEVVQEFLERMPKRNPRVHTCPFILALGGGIILVALMLDLCFSGDAGEEEADTEDDDEGFEYGVLPEDDMDDPQVGGGKPRVFVGIPVQVV